MLSEPRVAEAYETSAMATRKHHMPYQALLLLVNEETPPCNVELCSHYQVVVELQNQHSDLEMYTLHTLKKASRTL